MIKIKKLTYKFLSAVIFVIFCFYISIFPSFSLEKKQVALQYDYNITDATLVQRHLCYLITLSEEKQKEYDFDCDGTLTISDATRLQRYLAKLIDVLYYKPQEDETQAETSTQASDETQTAATEPTIQLTEDNAEPTQTHPTQQETSKPQITEVYLSDSSLILGIGEHYTLSAQGNIETDETIKYKSSDNNIATVDKNGNINAQGEGVVNITAYTDNKVSVDCEVTVKSAPLALSINKSYVKLGISESYNLVLSFESSAYILPDDIKWSSSNNNVAKINYTDEYKANIEAVGVGSATITVKTYNKKTVTCEVTVKEMATSLTLNQSSLTMFIGEQYDLDSYAKGDTAAYYRKYTSDDPSISEVLNSSGLIEAKAVGTTTIRCTLQNGVSAACKVQVIAKPVSISLNSTSLTLKVGNISTLSATYNNTTTSDENATWTSSDTKVVQITGSSDNKVNIKAMKQGSAVITVTGYNGLTAKCTITVSGSDVKCLDVSTWQGNIDFNKVKSSGIDYVIIRAGYGREISQKDSKFETNYTNAKRAGLKVGVYWYSYADSENNALNEADACLSVLDGRSLDMPVFYDMEEGSQVSLGKATCTKMARKFCDKIKSSGYQAGVYANAYWFSNYLDYTTIFKYYKVWLAQWSSSYDYICEMWQYTDSYTVYGISGNVDCSYIFDLNIVK